MSNMRHDTKIKRLINKYGLEGYGLYCLILESIVEKLSDTDPNPTLEDTCEDLASFYHNDTTKVNEITCYMVNQGLLELDEVTTRLTCHKIYKFLQQNATSSEKLRNMISNYKKSQLVVIESQQNVNRIEEKRKEKNRYRDNVSLTEKEYNKLIEKYGNNNIDKILDKLSSYKQAHGKRYKSDYGAINTWVIDSLKLKEKSVAAEPKYF